MCLAFLSIGFVTQNHAVGDADFKRASLSGKLALVRQCHLEALSTLSSFHMDAASRLRDQQETVGLAT